ncbi:MAG TPA: hypothetical protein VGI40_19190 [Pirellulaceae bacterium]
MKKVCVCLALSLIIGLAFSFQSASALPPFNKEWVAKYNTPEKAAYTEAKCNVCHAGESKKMKNEYGKAVGKYLTKAKYNEIKEDAAAAQKYILDGLAKAENDKSSSGKTYGELLKAGELPGK